MTVFQVSVYEPVLSGLIQSSSTSDGNNVTSTSVLSVAMSNVSFFTQQTHTTLLKVIIWVRQHYVEGFEMTSLQDRVQF